MKLSEVEWLNKEMIQLDKEFETLALIDSIVQAPICTFLDDEKYLKKANTNIAMLITTKEIYDKINDTSLGAYITDTPRIIYFKLHNYLSQNQIYARSNFKSKIGENCNISKMSSVSENNVIIGNNVTIEEFAVIRENTTINDDAIIRAGSIIGGEGFEFKHDGQTVLSVKHLGGVVIEKNAEIQYNVTVDKAVYPWDNTIVGEYSKIDNLSHIGHGCKIGKRTLIAAGSIIGGKTVIGDDTWIGIGTTIRNVMTIGNNARCNMGSVVTKNVGDGESVTGNFAVPHDTFIKHMKNICN